MQFVNVVSSEVFTGNPYEGNPHLKHIEPYKTIYERDKSKDKLKACQEFYAIWLMSSPDEEENKWMKLSSDKKKEIIAFEFKVDWKDPLIDEAIKLYPSLCMSHAERSLKTVRDKIDERDAFLKANPYTNDYYAKDANDQYIAKGNSFVYKYLTPKELDAMTKTTSSLFKELSEAEKLFKLEKDNYRIRGGRKATDFEDGSLFQDYDVDG